MHWTEKRVFISRLLFIASTINGVVMVALMLINTKKTDWIAFWLSIFAVMMWLCIAFFERRAAQKKKSAA